MNKNIEELFKDKMLNRKTEPPKNLWHNIDAQINKANFFKIIAFTVAGVLLIAGGIFYAGRADYNQKINNPVNSNYQITSSPQNTENHQNTDNQNIVSSNKNVKTNSDIRQVENITQNADIQNNSINDQIPENNRETTEKTNYKGFNVSENCGCQPLTITAENLEKESKPQWVLDDKTLSDNHKITITLSESGTHILTLNRLDNGIPNTFTKKIDVYEKPVADFSVPETISVKDEVVFENLSLYASSYKWYVDNSFVTTAENLYYSFSEDGEHKIMLIALNDNCSDTAIKSVTVVTPKEHIVFPTAFVPDKTGSNGGFYSNAKNENTVFHPYVFDKEIADYDLKIFNRRGELIFQSNDLNIGWDGYIRGKLAPMDVYVYSVKGSFTDGETFFKQGNVTLIY